MIHEHIQVFLIFKQLEQLNNEFTVDFSRDLFFRHNGVMLLYKQWYIYLCDFLSDKNLIFFHKFNVLGNIFIQSHIKIIIRVV